jgi:hypothetical protein
MNQESWILIDIEKIRSINKQIGIFQHFSLRKIRSRQLYT